MWVLYNLGPIFVLVLSKTFAHYNGDNNEYYSTTKWNIYQKISQEEEFEGFSGLIRNNRDAKIDLLQKELTLFVPTNDAFKIYEKTLHSNMASYHMAEGTRTLEDLKTLQNISSLNANFPKLWITKTSDGLFINNAQIITFKSNFAGKTRNVKAGKQQMLHVIDDVLDPVVRTPDYPHTAYDFLALTSRWDLDTDKTVTSFFSKVREYKLTHLYQLEGANTYFIPVDGSIDSYKFQMLNKYTIFGHMIPNYVLFTRPTMKEFTFETMANYDDIYIVLCFVEVGNKLYVKGRTVTGTENNPQGTFMAEIIEANIPVYNGVVHLISQPLGIFSKIFKPFPYLPILERLSLDPSLDTVYEMGERTGFNKIFSTHNVSFTYFVPNDYAWRQIQKQGLSYSGSEVDLLKRHLIVSESPYNMERLWAMTNNRNSSDVELKTVGGVLRLKVLLIESKYYIRWHNTYIKVLRPNYECPDGLLHVLAGPIATLH